MYWGQYTAANIKTTPNTTNLPAWHLPHTPSLHPHIINTSEFYEEAPKIVIFDTSFVLLKMLLYKDFDLISVPKIERFKNTEHKFLINVYTIVKIHFKNLKIDLILNKN